MIKATITPKAIKGDLKDIFFLALSDSETGVVRATDVALAICRTRSIIELDIFDHVSAEEDEDDRIDIQVPDSEETMDILQEFSNAARTLVDKVADPIAKSGDMVSAELIKAMSRHEVGNRIISDVLPRMADKNFIEQLNKFGIYTLEDLSARSTDEMVAAGIDEDELSTYQALLLRNDLDYYDPSTTEVSDVQKYVRERRKELFSELLLEELAVGVRSYNLLKRAGRNTIADVLDMTEGQLRAMPQMGRKSADDVVLALREQALCLKPESEL